MITQRLSSLINVFEDRGLTSSRSHRRLKRYRLGLDDVSYSPFRVPIARLAAAQAALAEKQRMSVS